MEENEARPPLPPPLHAQHVAATPSNGQPGRHHGDPGAASQESQAKVHTETCQK